ncbi:sensor histidine kinase [Nostoc sp. UHCC 0870]|uniref:sensor histidine kinase n=1 Tax=Nostoc sp. UHCC 0870 TaxID=2914041 RepID=UPI001EE07C4F|nr:ATP-binding protein [Nostoc sp. UHCC 0870]UKO97805.1 ATP-binding protein [Nostoc sp. UHCC 0870]
MKSDSAPLVDKLRATLGRMEVALGTIIDAITWTDENGKINWSNATFDHLVGKNRFQVLGANLLDLLPLTQQGQAVPKNLHPLSRALQHQLNATDVYEFQKLEKTLILEISWAYVQMKGANASAVLVVRDITAKQIAEEELQRHREQLRELVEERTAKLVAANEQLKKTQVQLVQTEKMSSLGRLVAGIAHEINNPVNFIYANLSYIQKYTEDLLNLLGVYQKCISDPPANIIKQAQEIELDFLLEDLPKALSSVEMGAERIRQIVLSLRNFSRLDEAELKKVDIHEGLDSTLVILAHRLKASADSPGIEIIKKYGDLPLVYCYAGQINQVFMNILSNAIDAIEECNKYETYHQNIITITTEFLVPDWISIRIADNGLGIPESIKSQVFDPFFTTKEVGMGTGLGLSISYQIIVEQHKGKIWCNSGLSKGTEFVMEIPVRPV